MAFKCYKCKKGLKGCKCIDFHEFINRCREDPSKRRYLMIHLWHILKFVDTAEREAFIMFHYNCNKRYVVDYKVCPIHNGGKHQTKNLKYVTNKEYEKKHGSCPKQIKLTQDNKNYMKWKKKKEKMQKTLQKHIRDGEKLF